MDRLERLVNLVAALIDAERPLSREQIHARVGGYAADEEAFRRNFERDKDLLRQMGLPLVLEPVDRLRPDGLQGYRIPRESYELPDPGLDDEELGALRLAGSVVSIDAGWQRDTTTTALRKLAAATGVASPTPPAPAAGVTATATTLVPTDERVATALVPTDERVATALVPTDERVATAFAAVAARQALEFVYRGERRRVDPWHLSFRRGQWYLSGWDHSRQEERMFRLDRVDGSLDAVGSPAAFERPAGAAHQAPPPWRLGDEPEVVADVLVDAEQADWALKATGPAALAERFPSGAVRLELRVTNREAFRSFVLGFLDHAEVLGPPELRDDMVSWLETIALRP